jgi:iron(III) transport system permease protein
VIVVGVSTAWLVTMHDFPGRRFFEWALVLPLAVPAYVMAYTYTDLLQFVGPVQTWLRESFGWQKADYWFPDVRTLGGAVAMFTFVLYPYVYLLARTAFLERASGMLEVGRSLGLSAWGSFFRISLPLARPGRGGGRGAGADGNPGRLRHGGLFRGADVHHRHLPRLVLAGRPRRRRPAFRRAARLRHSGAAAGAHEPRPGALPQHTGRNKPSAGCGSPARARPPPCWPAPCRLFAGFLLPAGVLLEMALTEGDAQFGARFLQLAGNSFTLAA